MSLRLKGSLRQMIKIFQMFISMHGGIRKAKNSPSALSKVSDRNSELASQEFRPPENE